MSNLEEQLLSSRPAFDGRLLKLRVDTVKLPSGKEATREVVEHPGAVAIVAVTDDQELVLVRQYRRAAGSILLEVPAGTLAKGEPPAEAALRELEEETGYRAKKVKKVFSGFVAPGYSTEMIHFYLAEEMTLLRPHTEDDEFIEVDLVDLETCLDLVKRGEIKDNKTIIGIMIADLASRGELA